MTTNKNEDYTHEPDPWLWVIAWLMGMGFVAGIFVIGTLIASL